MAWWRSRRRKGTALVNPAKVDPAVAKAQLDAGGGGQLLGMATDTKPPGAAAVLQTKTPAGVPVKEELVTPQTLPAAIAAGEAVAPGGTHELKPPQQIVSERLEGTPTTTVFDPAHVQTVEFPVKDLKLSADVPNFKGGASEETGTVAGQELAGKYERTGTAPIVAWERLNGDTEVITGRHRLDLAKRTGETTIPTQIVREADGFTKENALTFNAEANIRDGQGEVSDYATYFKGVPISETEARARGLLSRAKGRAGYALAKSATDDVYALWQAGKLDEKQAVAIATTAPGDVAAQQIGSKFALQGKSADFITNVIKASKAWAQQRGQNLDLFGNDDAAMKEMAGQAEIAGTYQREITENIRAVSGAAKRPDVARKLGVDVRDPAGIVNKVAELKSELARWENWPMQPDLVAKVRGESPRDQLYREAEAERTLVQREYPPIYAKIVEASGLAQRELDALLIPSPSEVSHRSEVNNIAADLARNAPGGRMNKLYDLLADKNKTGRFMWGGTADNPKLGFDPDTPNQSPDPVAARRALKAVNDIRRVFGAEPLPDFFPEPAAGAGTHPRSTELFGGETPFNLAGEQQKFVAPTAETTGHGADTLTQHDLFAIAEVTKEVDPFKSANAAEKLYGGAKPAVARLQNQLRVMDSDPAVKRSFTKEQRNRLAEVLNVLNERAGGRVAASGASAPRPAPTRSQLNKGVPANVPAVPPNALHPVQQWLANKSFGIKSVFAPGSISAALQAVANILRELLGESALNLDRAAAVMHAARNEFDRTPVPRNWQYDPAQPLPHNYAIIDAFERNRLALPQRYQELARYFDQAFADRIKTIQQFAPQALNHLIENYFPHIWTDARRAEGVMAQVSNRLFAGRKEFLKERTLPFFAEGLARGLKPISDNPVDLLLAKLHSMDKFIVALKAQAEFKATGALKFKYALERMPEGWVKFADPAFVVNAPPVVTFKEAFDAQLRTRTEELLRSLGVPESRLATLGGKRWGLAYETPEQIKTRFAGPLSVYWHELGHILDYRYHLQRDFIKQGKIFDDQLRALANARLPEGDTGERISPTTGKKTRSSFSKYTRKSEEKMAVMLEAYTHAPDVFREHAPDVFRQFENFIDAHPELHGLRELKPSVKLGTGTIEKELPGILKLGDWIMPEGPAQVIHNYLSPGLARFGAYRSIRTMSNVLNGAQLGLSAFHIGFTSVDAATSALALGIKQLVEGRGLDSLRTLAEVPISPLSNLITGGKLKAEALTPGTHPEMAQLVKALERAGGRVGNDRMWQTEFTRRMIRAWHEGGLQWATLPIRVPLAAWEQAMRPILEYVVPRQKLGVFARMAQYELAKLPPDADAAAQREALRKAWDSVDNRMGQVVYDNLFYNRAIKDVALLSFRAYGWQLGKYREGLGAVADTVGGLNQIPEVPKAGVHTPNVICDGAAIDDRHAGRIDRLFDDRQAAGGSAGLFPAEDRRARCQRQSGALEPSQLCERRDRLRQASGDKRIPFVEPARIGDVRFDAEQGLLQRADPRSA